ncbi:MAG: nucleoside deaminase [Bacteroidota bacterium]
MPDHTFFMKIALKEAAIAFEEGEVPVGALIVSNNIIIAKSHNQTEKLTDITAHAEMIAITSATNFLGAKYLKGCTLYVTLEPCVMCAGALYWSQIDRIVFGAFDEKRGFSRINSTILHPKTELIGGVMQNESEQLLRAFFKLKRR